MSERHRNGSDQKDDRSICFAREAVGLDIVRLFINVFVYVTKISYLFLCYGILLLVFRRHGVEFVVICV